jgi:hypothetical protein
MSGVFIVAIVFSGIVMAIAIISGTILMAIKLRHGGGLSQTARHQQNQEAEMIQEIYHGLESLEKRLEALETILLDRTRKEV